MIKKKKPKTHQEKVNKTHQKSTAKIIKEIPKSEGIINAIGDGLSILDRTYKVLYENRVHRDMFGDNVGEYCYKTYQKREGICGGCPVALTFKDGKVYTVQRTKQTDRGMKYFEVAASPLKDSKGEIIAGIEVVRDITERKNMQDEILKIKDRLDFILTTAPVALYTSKVSGNYGATFISGSIKSLLGYKPEEFFSTSSFWTEHIHPEDKERVLKELSSIFEHGYFVHEYRFRHADGTYKWMHDECKLNYDNNDNPLEIIGCWMDTTEQKKIEEELKDRIKELEDFYDMAIGRELKMTELKQEIEALKKELEEYKKQE